MFQYRKRYDSARNPEVLGGTAMFTFSFNTVNGMTVHVMCSKMVSLMITSKGFNTVNGMTVHVMKIISVR